MRTFQTYRLHSSQTKQYTLLKQTWALGLLVLSRLCQLLHLERSALGQPPSSRLAELRTVTSAVPSSGPESSTVVPFPVQVIEANRHHFKSIPCNVYKDVSAQIMFKLIPKSLSHLLYQRLYILEFHKPIMLPPKSFGIQHRVANF